MRMSPRAASNASTLTSQTSPLAPTTLTVGFAELLVARALLEGRDEECAGDLPRVYGLLERGALLGRLALLLAERWRLVAWEFERVRGFLCGHLSALCLKLPQCLHWLAFAGGWCMRHLSAQLHSFSECTKNGHIKGLAGLLLICG